MALVSVDSDASLLARVDRVRRTAAEHKAEVRRHRQALQITMQHLAALEQECRRRGLLTSSGVEGHDLHGHHDSDTTDS